MSAKTGNNIVSKRAKPKLEKPPLWIQLKYHKYRKGSPRCRNIVEVLTKQKTTSKLTTVKW